jgi:hypothetical protein
MAERRPHVSLAQMNLTLLDSIRPSDYHESLEEALEIAAIAASGFRKQFAIFRETLRPDCYPTSFTGSSVQSRQPLPPITIDISKGESMDHETS